MGRLGCEMDGAWGVWGVAGLWCGPRAVSFRGARALSWVCGSSRQVFKECRADEVVEIVQRVELLHASEGQYLVQEGHKSPGLYTIIRGSIEVLKGESPAQHGTHLRTRWPGEIFGEASLLGTGQLATASCVAAVMSELMLLRKDAWDDLVRLFPELHSRMERYASDKDRVGEGDAFAKCAQMHRDNADRRCAPSKADPFMV